MLIAFFNPARFKRILKNALYIISVLKEAKIPYFVVECTFHKARPQIPGADLVLNSDSYMFYKEQLLNKLEPRVPEKYTKLVFLDADVLLDTPDWIDQISESLNSHDILQPFSQSCWLTPDNTRIRSKKCPMPSLSSQKRPLIRTLYTTIIPDLSGPLNAISLDRLGVFSTVDYRRRRCRNSAECVSY